MKLWENGSTVPPTVLSLDSHGSREVNFVEICGTGLLQKYMEVNLVEKYGGDFFGNIWMCLQLKCIKVALLEFFVNSHCGDFGGHILISVQ